MSKKRAYLDVDTTDGFLDLPEPVYQPDGKPGRSGAALDELLDPEYRRAHGLGPVLKLPPVTDR